VLRHPNLDVLDKVLTHVVQIAVAHNGHVQTSNVYVLLELSEVGAIGIISFLLANKQG
jgi:hypothetical protein